VAGSGKHGNGPCSIKDEEFFGYLNELLASQGGLCSVKSFSCATKAYIMRINQHKQRETLETGRILIRRSI
jgi:hypothetical protein